MARPREFEEAAVLDAAVQCFWARGYEATSVHDLAEKMGITGASLYNAFGDKRALYRRALDQYVEQSFGDGVGRFEGKFSPRGDRSLFQGDHRTIVERHGAKRLHVGELGARDGAPRPRVSAVRCRGPGSGGRFFSAMRSSWPKEWND